MLVVEVRGKSTRQIRKVYVLVTAKVATAIERILSNPVSKAPHYIFTRYATKVVTCNH